MSGSYNDVQKIFKIKFKSVIDNDVWRQSNIMQLLQLCSDCILLIWFLGTLEILTTPIMINVHLRINALPLFACMSVNKLWEAQYSYHVQTPQ